MEDETDSPLDDLEASEDTEDDELGDAGSVRIGGVVAIPGEPIARGTTC